MVENEIYVQFTLQEKKEERMNKSHRIENTICQRLRQALRDERSSLLQVTKAFARKQ